MIQKMTGRIYYVSDEQLEEFCEQFIERNRFFHEKIKEYHIVTYDTSIHREYVLAEILQALEKLCQLVKPCE